MAPCRQMYKQLTLESQLNSCVDGAAGKLECYTAPVQGILEWCGHCWRQCIEAHSDGCAGIIFSPSFFCCLDGLLLYRRALHCTVTDFCFPCHQWYNRTKEVYTEGLLWKNKSGRQLVRKFQDNKTWAAGCFELYACTKFTSTERHHVGATPPRLYSPRLLIIRQPKSGTAKTVPAVPAAPALLHHTDNIQQGWKIYVQVAFTWWFMYYILWGAKWSTHSCTVSRKHWFQTMLQLEYMC